MKVLLDTHVLIWMMANSQALSPGARKVLLNHDNELFFSIAGYWEIGIKTSIGKLELASRWNETIPREMTRNGISWLPIDPNHVHAVSSLPWIHRDPFDRIMIAQAIHEGLVIVTGDPFFREYPVQVVW